MARQAPVRFMVMPYQPGSPSDDRYPKTDSAHKELSLTCAHFQLEGFYGGVSCTRASTPPPDATGSADKGIPLSTSSTASGEWTLTPERCSASDPLTSSRVP